jgi:hypothetical protein
MPSTNTISGPAVPGEPSERCLSAAPAADRAILTASFPAVDGEPERATLWMPNR